MEKVKCKDKHGNPIVVKVPDKLFIKDCNPVRDSYNWNSKYTDYYEVPYQMIGDAVAESVGIDLDIYGYVIEYTTGYLRVTFIPKEE